MKPIDLLKALGNIKDSYVISAEEFRQGKQQVKVKRLSTKRALLIAAVIALTLLLVGCAVVYVLRMQNLHVGEYSTYMPTIYDEDGNVIPVETSRSIVHLDGGKAAKKIERWQKIAQEASQQSKRVQVPAVGPYLSWKQCLQQLKEEDGLTIIFWEDEQTQSLKALLRSQPQKPAAINLIVGPEGGLSGDEVNQLRDIGAVSASLGKRILRTETAGMAGVAIVLYEYDEMN